MLSKSTPKETDEGEVILRKKHRRQSSLGASFRRSDDSRRRSSYASSSWVRDADDEAEPDELSTRTGRSRPGSWGPIGEFFYRDSLSFCDSERSPVSHHECNSKKANFLSVNSCKSLQCNCIKDLTPLFKLCLIGFFLWM